MRRFYTLLAALLILPWLVSAQESDMGSLSGTVQDANESPLGGVKVTVEGSSQTEPIVVETDKSGKFGIEELEAGLYKVTAELMGYATVTQEGIPIEAAHHYELEITMNPVPISP
jgi:uncharacterized protein (DUF2141 family)